jgi:hypothetical protein
LAVGWQYAVKFDDTDLETIAVPGGSSADDRVAPDQHGGQELREPRREKLFVTLQELWVECEPKPEFQPQFLAQFHCQQKQQFQFTHQHQQELELG